MTAISSNHPFASAAQFEAAIVPYLKLPKPRDIRSGLYCRGSFRTRLLHDGVGLMEAYDYRTRTKHPRLRFRGTFPEFLRKLFADMALYFDDRDDNYSPEQREIARLYGIALPAPPQHGDRSSCTSPSSHCMPLQSP